MESYHRHSSDPHQAPYSSSYDSRSYQPSSYHQDPSARDPRDAYAPGQPTHQTAPQPLHNVLNNAFDKSDSAGKVDPELIAQITAEVKKSVLDEIKSGMGVTAHPSVAPQQSWPPQSPASTASIPPRNVYTPPSPKHTDLSSHGSVSPDPLPREPPPREPLDGNDDTPTPRYERSAPIDIPQERVSRPAAPPRMDTDLDFSPIEKKWQRLFDLQGQSTPRLGQFLRGLAIHLIEDYEPKKSLVISPAKMLKFYQDVKLEAEIYPWDTIFGKLPYPTLCKIYRELRCEHHLIQEHTAAQPDIPALTPFGFQHWMTALIQAYPDAEYSRLSRAVLDMPISNADDQKERFPKELPRRLFPHTEHLPAQQRIAAVLSAENVGPLRRAPTFPPPPPMTHSASVPPSLERERSPYSTTPYSATDPRAVVSDTDDEDATPLSMPIERERKPYSAAPGGGKVYADDAAAARAASDAAAQPPRYASPRRRTQSATGSTPYIPPPPPDPSQYPPPRTARRTRSPSFSAYTGAPRYAEPNDDVEAQARRFSSKDASAGAETRNRHEWAARQAQAQAQAQMDGSSGRAHQRRGTAGTDSSHESAGQRSAYEDEYYKGRGGDGGGRRY